MTSRCLVQASSIQYFTLRSVKTCVYPFILFLVGDIAGASCGHNGCLAFCCDGSIFGHLPVRLHMVLLAAESSFPFMANT